jgi:S-DNA-T family DNA segregation ATPase FtsK/SpoIIIE
MFESCEECGFNGEEWTDSSALDFIGSLPRRWRLALSGMMPGDLARRASPRVWSVAEYADHVREVLFSMRFLLDVAIDQPGTDLGISPQPRFDPDPRRIDVTASLFGIDSEATSLRDRLARLPLQDWDRSVVVDGTSVDAHWIARHAVHDARHHLLDVERLRRELHQTANTSGTR